MKKRVICVNGHNYVYGRDTIFVALGKSEKIEKSLGPANSPNLLAKETIFNDLLKKEEIKKRLAYWRNKIKDNNFLHHITLESLETLRSDLYRAKKNMGPVGVDFMETGFLVDFIYNSNRLEGSKVPRDRVEKEVREKKKTRGEVGNTIKAVLEVNSNFKFNVNRIVKLHSTLMAHESDKLGLRKGPVTVGNSEVTPWEEIKERLAALCQWYKENKASMYPLELAFDFYYRFERIHPFEDGNGRTGRLLMNRILRDNKYHPIIISWKRKEAQENAFKKRIEGRSETFHNFMKEEFVKIHRIYIAKISAALDMERLAKVFLQPSNEYA